MLIFFIVALLSLLLLWKLLAHYLHYLFLCDADQTFGCGTRNLLHWDINVDAIGNAVLQLNAVIWVPTLLNAKFV